MCVRRTLNNNLSLVHRLLGYKLAATQDLTFKTVPRQARTFVKKNSPKVLNH